MPLTNLNTKPGKGEKTSGKWRQIVWVGTLETSKEGGRVAHVRNLKLTENRIDLQIGDKDGHGRCFM